MLALGTFSALQGRMRHRSFSLMNLMLLVESGEEVSMTNQLLTEMDDFESDINVVVIAATNRPEALDPALCRPGRFSRKVYVSEPDEVGRKKILVIHLRGVPLEEDIGLICNWWDIVAHDPQPLSPLSFGWLDLLADPLTRTDLSPIKKVLRDIHEGQWQWPTITDIEYMEILHALPIIHGGNDWIMWRFLGNVITTQALYRLFDLPGPKVGWSSLLSGPLKVTRHMFILWLAIQEKLATTDKQ
ncbi:UNVERIFIED_CONTAM: putative inactive ATP-dependent zinc metalloprotease FTSHI 3, chloroplastic [Sesamum indicum]